MRLVIILALRLMAAEVTSAESIRGKLPQDLSTWVHTEVQKDLKRIWTTADLAKGVSIGNYGQMRPFLQRLEDGLPVTVVAFGDSIAASYGGCFHRDR